MKKIILLCVFLFAFLSGCGTINTQNAQQPEQTQEISKEEAEMMKTKLILTINGAAVPVIWEDNASVEKLIEHAGKEALSVKMSMYGGWEQVGSLGFSLPRNDVQQTAKNGDIMLYSGNQIVLFYGDNSWAYTKLGRMELSKSEVTALLSGGDVTITLSVE